MHRNKEYIIYLMIIFNISFSFKDSYGQPFNIKASLLPLNILHPNQPYLTGGIEIILKEKIGLEFDYGQRVLPHGVFISKPYEQIIAPAKGEKIQFEAKLYNVVGKKIFSLENQKTYIGICYRRIKDTRNLAITYWMPDSVGATSFHGSTEHTAIKKRIDAINVVIGYVDTYYRLSVDGSIMIGIKRKVQSYIENEYYELGYDSYRHWIWDQPMNSFKPSLYFRIKLSYRLI